MKKETHHEHRHIVRSSHNIGFNRKYTTIALYSLITLFIAAVFIFFLLNGDKYSSVFDFISGILSPILLGILIAYLLNPCMSFFENVIFISKSKRALRKARKAHLFAKLKYDRVRLSANSPQAGVEAALQALNDARTKLRTARAIVQNEEATRQAKYAAKAARKSRLSYHPTPAKDRSHPMRGLSILCTYLLFFAIISLILWIVIPQIIDSMLSLIDNLEAYIRSLPQKLQDLVNNNKTIQDIYNLVNEQIDLKAWLISFVENSTEMLSGLLTSLPNFAVSVISAIASGITNLILSIFLSIYFLATKEKLSYQLQRLCRAFLPRRAFHHLRHAIVEVDRKFGKYIAGKILDSSIIALVALVAMMIMDMPYYQMIALIIGITNIIPFFGPFIGAFIGGFLLLISGPSHLIPFLIMVLILQQLEGNVIEPQVLGDSLGLSPVWIMIAIIIMSGLFGFFGMIFGVPIFAVIYTLLTESVDNRLKKRAHQALTHSFDEDSESLDDIESDPDTPGVSPTTSDNHSTPSES